MNKSEADFLPLGLYKVHWKSGGHSLAAIGMLPNGDRWLAPINWVHPTEDQNVWNDIEKLEVVPLKMKKGDTEEVPATLDGLHKKPQKTVKVLYKGKGEQICLKQLSKPDSKNG